MFFLRFGIFLFVSFSLSAAAQRHDVKPYYFIDLDSGKYESIIKVNVYFDDTTNWYQTSFRSDEKEGVGYVEYPEGYIFLTQSCDTFYLTRETNIFFGDSIWTDTINWINKGIVFTNPFPDFYLSDSLSFQSPFLIMDSEQREKDGTDFRGPIGRIYTYTFDENGMRAGCILNDENGTLYYYMNPNGTIKAKGYFKDALPKGKWQFYKKDGSFDYEYFFE